MRQVSTSHLRMQQQDQMLFQIQGPSSLIQEKILGNFYYIIVESQKQNLLSMIL